MSRNTYGTKVAPDREVSKADFAGSYQRTNENAMSTFMTPLVGDSTEEGIVDTERAGQCVLALSWEGPDLRARQFRLGREVGNELLREGRDFQFEKGVLVLEDSFGRGKSNPFVPTGRSLYEKKSRCLFLDAKRNLILLRTWSQAHAMVFPPLPFVGESRENYYVFPRR